MNTRRWRGRSSQPGQRLGPHSDGHLLYCDWTDRGKTLVTEAEFKADLRKNLADLATISGPTVAKPTLFLPPFEWFNDDQARWSRELGLTLVNFTPGSGSNRDYVPESDPKFVASTRIASELLACEAKEEHGMNGFILLMHAGSSRADKMTDRLDGVVVELQRRGYAFVPLETLVSGGTTVGERPHE